MIILAGLSVPVCLDQDVVVEKGGLIEPKQNECHHVTVGASSNQNGQTF